MTWGKEIKTLQEIWKDTGVKPRALRDRPKLHDSQRYYLKAFYELSAGRSFGEVPQPISVRDIKDYCELFEIDDLPSKEALFRTVRTLDSAWLARVMKQEETTLPGSKTNAS